MNKNGRTTIFWGTLGLSALWVMPALAGGTRMTGGSTQILRNQEANGGQVVSGGSFALNNTVGDVVASAGAGGSFQLFPGLQNVEAQPGSVVSITTTTKSTGTLDLAWTAPGADGALGGVIGGYYRIDYSSDPAHVFSPLTFQQEFSTTVVPGSPQFLEIGGLSPNTTYYTKIYLADARKYFAEDSARSDQSTLANAPVNPVFSGVFATSVTISWTLPAPGGDEGFSAGASSTNFGALLPGGAVVTSNTANGVQVSLTISGLNPSTTYFFKVASLNWQGDKNYSVVIGTATSGGLLPIFNLASFPNALGHSVSMTWSNPQFAGFDQVLVVVSTNAAAPPVVNGQSYSVGQVLSDNSVVRSTAVATAFSAAGLALDQAYYYSFYAGGAASQYSVSVSTSVFLDLPPMPPAALSTVIASDRSSIIIKWNQVTSKNDGTAFHAPAAPIPPELSEYDVYRASSPINPNWVRVATVPFTANIYTDNIPDPSINWAYKVEAVDSLGAFEFSMARDLSDNLYVYGPDQVTQLQVPPSLLPYLRGASNGLGSDIIVRATAQTPQALKNIFRDVRFDAYRTPGNELVADYHFPTADATVTLDYAVQNGKVAPMSSFVADIAGSDAANNLGMYWSPLDNGQYRKLYGTVDAQRRTVSVKSPFMGDYQIRSLLRSESLNFDLSNLSNKVITPNGDGKNDIALFTMENPRDSAVSGQIFDASGAVVSDMAAGPATGGGTSTLQWDAKSHGRVVPGGVYLYQIRGEGKVFNGTILVIR